MNTSTFVKKAFRYISCACKYTLAHIAAPFMKNNRRYTDLWLISERGIDARDNAYYLFKYITENHPEVNAAFAITKTSPDRSRVAALGRIINHNSMEHYIALLLSNVKISTHIMGYTPYIDFFVRADRAGLVKGKKIFLQHGIIKDNITYLYHNNVNLDLFVCSAEPEYNNISQLYGYPEGVVRLLGLCRYDALYKHEKPTRKILVMPTWRYNLKGAGKNEFLKSGYYSRFNSLLTSERLNGILAKYDYELMFYPHIEMQKFIDCFTSGERVSIKAFGDCTVQELLINSDVLITDFSSVFFDYAYMEKPMIFYQFDEAEFRQQQYSEGYFDYRRDAFGRVTGDLDSVIDELEAILSRGACIEEKYLDRINKFFTLRDRHSCERNFKAIKEIVQR